MFQNVIQVHPEDGRPLLEQRSKPAIPISEEDQSNERTNRLQKKDELLRRRSSRARLASHSQRESRSR